MMSGRVAPLSAEAAMLLHDHEVSRLREIDAHLEALRGKRLALYGEKAILHRRATERLSVRRRAAAEAGRVVL